MNKRSIPEHQKEINRLMSEVGRVANKQRDNILVKLHQQNPNRFTYSELAKLAGVTRQRVHQIVRDHEGQL